MILASGARGPGFNSQNGPCSAYSSYFELAILPNQAAWLLRGRQPSRGPAKHMWQPSCYWRNDQGVREPVKVVPRGLEPRTLRLLAVRSNQLSYETSEALASQCALQQSEVRWRPHRQIMLPYRQPATYMANAIGKGRVPANFASPRGVAYGRLE